MRYSAIYFTLLLGIVVLSGCAMQGEKIKDIRASFYMGNMGEARELIAQEMKKGKKKEADVLKLELAMIDLVEGKTKEAEKTLREVRDTFDHLEQKSLAEGTMSMLSDDTYLSYSGDDYERVMIRTMLAISDLMNGGENAYAYAAQIEAKQRQIIEDGFGKKVYDDEENPKLRYKQLAIGPYLRGTLREESFMNFDDAQRCFAQVVHWEPTFSQGRADLDRATHGHHTEPGNGALYVFTFVGRGPFKAAQNAEATQISLLIADRILTAATNRQLPPTLAPVLVPVVYKRPNKIENVGICVNGRPSTATETITDIGQIAVEQNEALYHDILARAIVRRIVKKSVIYSAQEVLDTNAWTGMALAAVGVVWEATESADTRCWGLLPNQIQVARIELPEGEHFIEMQACANRGMPIGEKYGQSVRIRNGRNTYMLASFPTEQMVGIIQSSDPVEENTMPIIQVSHRSGE